MEFNEILAVLMFASFLGLLFTGFPIAWVLAGVGILFTALAIFTDIYMQDWLYANFPDTWLDVGWPKFRGLVQLIWEQMRNWVLVALPMFIFMGLMLDRSGIAEKLMENFSRIFGRMRGGLAVTVTLIGVLLAASTGIIGAAVVLLTVLALPVMLKNHYSIELGVGTVAAVGTLGILIPPSIMLVLMADRLGMSVGDLFLGALLPGLLLGGLYITYILVLAWLKPSAAPAPQIDERLTLRDVMGALLAAAPPALLILMVLGSIFFGIATPTEASGVGAFGATMLAAANRRLSWAVLRDVARATTETTAFIFGIIVGAVAFALALRWLEGDILIKNTLIAMDLGSVGTILVVLLIVFLLGFLLDWIQIILIVLPLVGPLIGNPSDPSSGMWMDLGFDSPNHALIWFTLLFAVVLQTSFLTPPVGFALFYVKGVAPPQVTVRHIYRGVMPFIGLQAIGVLALFFWPQLALWLPRLAYGQ